MITTRWVFADQRLPDTLLHRHAEREQLSRALEPAIYGHRAEDVLIHGPSGVGKTTTARHVLERQFGDQQIDWALINSHNTRCAILHETAVTHPTETAVQPNSPAEELVETLEQIVDRPYVVLLDEADTICDLAVLCDLYQVPLLSVVAIVHDPNEWLARLDSDLRDSISLRSQIAFERYSQAELVDILEPRVTHGLEPDVVRDEQLEWIADEVAGVARYGIQSLLAAAEVAVERGHDRIRNRDVEDSFERARAKVRQANLRSLPFGPCVVYELLRREGDELVSGSRLHERYEDVAPTLYADQNQEPVSRRRRVDFLTKLVEYDLIRQHGENRWAEYEVVDSELEAPIHSELPVSV